MFYFSVLTLKQTYITSSPNPLGQQMIKNSLFTCCHLVTKVRKL